MREEAEIQTVRETGKRICSSRATDLRNLQLTLPSTSLTLWSVWDWQCSAQYPSAKSSSNCPTENVPFFAACTASYLVAVSHSLPIPDLSQWSRWSGRCCRHCRRRGFFCTVAITMGNVGQTPFFLPSSIDKFCQIILLPPQTNEALFFNLPPFLTHHVAVSQHKRLYPLISTTPSSFPSRANSDGFVPLSVYYSTGQSVSHSRLLLPPDHVRVPRPPVCKGFRGSSPQQQP